jgi:hypothetical protein
MKEIDLIDAFNYMRLSDGVILEGRLVELSLIGIEHDSKNEFAYITWSEHVRGEWVDFDIAFKEGDNEFVVVDGPYMTLINSDTGEEEELMLLRSWDVEEAYENGGLDEDE